MGSVEFKIPEWFDEDGEQVTSAVIVLGQGPADAKQSKLGNKHFATLKTVWHSSGQPMHDGYPLIIRIALKQHLHGEGRADRTIENDLNPSYADKLIGTLLGSKAIAVAASGWIVIDAATVILWKSETTLIA